ncbi:MAG TPA: ankyrin repeat domain-containing protein [Candidatus Eisenbacteria bacterium]|nr:ankyrin repeat domain-containing protein [Candidatus Eisenbacteria bacterium]
MHRSRRWRTLLLALFLILPSAGCGDARKSLEEIVEIVLRERARNADAKQVRADPILEFSFRGNVEGVRRLLAADPKAASKHVRSRDPVGMTALHLAVWGGHPEIVRLLLEHGADVNAQDGGGGTPVLLAARWGRGDLMHLLLEHGADASITDDQGRTLLHKAAEYGHVEVMRALLKHGFDVNVQARPGTPLHSAAFRREVLAAKFLLDHGANPNARGFLEWAPLHVASGQAPKDEKSLEFVTLMLDRGAEVAARGEDGITPLVLAAGAMDSAVVALLLARGARPESATPRGFSALRSAVDAKAPGIAHMLLVYGADPNQRYSPPGQERLLHRAANLDKIDVARELLDFKADVNALDDRRLTPLHVAAREGRTEMIRLLLERRANVHARDKWNWTPLHFAASQRHLEAVRILLDAGADRNARNSSRETPAKLAWGPAGQEIRQVLGSR